MPNRFLRYLQEAGTDLRRFDATDPELMRGFLEWTVWDVRRQPTARARHALAVELALECLEVVAGPAEGRLTVLPTDFLDQIQKCLDVHKNIRAGMRPGMSEAYAWAMDYV